MSLDKDPLDWTVDDVVDFLCHTTETPWSKSVVRNRPDPASFEAILRENFITGEALLHDVDVKNLNEDLGIKALGHRSSVVRAIQYLRERSGKYQSTQDNPKRQFENVHHGSPVPSYLEKIATPHSETRTPQHRNDRETPPSHASNAASNWQNQLSSYTEPVQEIPETRNESGLEASDNGTVHEDADSGVINRPKESVVVDETGRKRRRLQLSPQVRETDIKNANPEPALDKEWYMGPHKIGVSQLFYPFTSDDDDQSFVLLGGNFPTALRSFVKNSLQYSYRQRPVRLKSKNGKHHWGVFPCKPLNEDSQKYFTLYTKNKGKITVRQEETQRWPELNTTKSSSVVPPSSSDPFAYLIHKYPVEEDNPEKAYPTYGESGSEGEYDEETWEEIDNERQDPEYGKVKKLSLCEVDSIINNCVIEIESKWHESKKPKEEMGARNLWLMAKRGKSTNRRIKALAQNIQLQERRLRKVQSTIRDNEYHSKQELCLVCQTMEYPIFNIVKQKWRTMVLEQEQCPPQIGFAPEKRPKSKQRPKNDNGEESLSSESDFISDDFQGGADEPIGFSMDDQSEPSADVTATGLPERPQLSSDSSSDDDINLSAKARKARRRRQIPLSLRSSPSEAANDKPETEMVDLTMDTPPPDDFMIETPPLNPVSNNNPVRNPGSASAKLERNSISPAPTLGARVSVEIPKAKVEMPGINDFAALEKLDWARIEGSIDKGRLLAKLIAGLADEERKSIFDLLPNYGVKRLRNSVRSALNALFQGQGNVEGLPPPKNQLVMRTAILFVSYVNCAPLSQEVISRHQIVNAQMDLSGFTYFFGLLSQVLEAYHEWKNAKNEPVASSTPHKKRKKEVKESQHTKINQENAQERVLLQELRKEKLQKSWENMGISNNDPRHQVVSFGDPVVYLHEHNGTRVMPHQLSGIQFMWRELIQDENYQGCLLAHTMGLGKTMQVVSLLSTVYLAASASDERTRNQVPKHLHRSQTLVLCPSSLIENWFEEFCMWTPPSNPLGPLRKVTAATKPEYRLQEVDNWNKDGGVLILSYNIFRMWILNKEGKRKGRQPVGENDSDQNDSQDNRKCLSKRDHERVKDWLLNGPRIIVADEAHTMKNPSTAIYQSAIQFRSKSRIALTGSPLANNLVDYYTMLDWIACGYLGEFKEFKAKYVEPIEEGLYADSTYAERRRSLVRLQVLKEILEPKVNRADITALAGHLPPKVEFVITVPLTKLQEDAYNVYVNSVSASALDVGTAKLWSWLAILGLCCNHPSCFWDKLNNRANDSSPAQTQGQDKDYITPGDESIEQAGIPDSNSLLFKEKPLFGAVGDLKALHLSYRALMLDKIIGESVKAGDKILVFSHSIPTLDYLEDVLMRTNRKCCRLDGSTRPSDRQTATKTFNKSGGEQVYLISTRAGGLGLNIPGANRVIIFDFQFNPVWEEQAVGRVYRLGQQKPVFVYRFISGGTYEEKIFDRAIFKTHLATRVVDKKNPVRFASKAMGREYLRPATSVPQKDLSEFMGKDPYVLDQIIKNDNGPEKMIRKITLTETFQREDNDKLTEEERKGVEMHLNDERLKRANPRAYEELLHKREMDLAVERGRLMARQSQPYQHETHAFHNRPVDASLPYQHPQPPHQLSHNVGPRPLPPDRTASRPVASTNMGSHPFTNLPPNYDNPPQLGSNKPHPLPPRPPAHKGPDMPQSSPQGMLNTGSGADSGIFRNEKTAEKPTPETSSNLNVNNSNRTLPQQDGSGDSTGMPGKDTNCRSQ